MSNRGSITAKKLQPNSRRCFVCGLENPFGLKLRFYESVPGENVPGESFPREIEAETTVPEQYQGYPGVVHGGIVAAMLDEVAGRVHMNGDPPRFMYTARLELRYRKNVPVGQPLRLVGRAGKRKGRSAVASSAIYAPDGELLAEADALLVDVPADVIDAVDLEALGWRVYPDENPWE